MTPFLHTPFYSEFTLMHAVAIQSCYRYFVHACVLLTLSQKIEELKVQLSRFEEENTKPCCFNWPVTEDGKQLVFSDRNDGYTLHDQRNCDGTAHSVPNDMNSGEDSAKGLADTDSAGCKGLNRTTDSDDIGNIGFNTTANCEGVRTNGEDLASVQLDPTQCRELTDKGMNRHRKPSDLSVATGNSDVTLSSSNGDATPATGDGSSCTDPTSDTTSDPTVSDPTLTDPPSSSVTSAVPTSNQIDAAQTDSDVAELKKAPTEIMSPRSYAVFKSELIHVPEMNLPWESMRNTTKCGCGVTFSYSVRKVHINDGYSGTSPIRST